MRKRVREAQGTAALQGLSHVCWLALCKIEEILRKGKAWARRAERGG